MSEQVSEQLSPRPRGRAPHVPALDGVRGVAIALVIIYHVGIFSRIAAGSPPLAAIEAPLFFIADRGYLGVDLFFALSGFLITGILADAKGTTTTGDYLRSFYVRRARRIFPLYYAMLAFLVLVLPALYAPWAAATAEWSSRWAWSYLLNVEIVRGVTHVPAMVVHFWSLAVEEQFYFVWPLAVLALSRRGMMRLCGGAVLLSIVLRHVLLPVFPGRPVNWLMPARLDALAAGAFVALLLRGPVSRSLVRRVARGLGIGAALALVAAQLVVAFGSPTDVAMADPGTIPLAALLSACVIAWVALADSRTVPIVSHPVPRFLGRYSYAIYVLHQPIIVVLLQLGAFRSLAVALGPTPTFGVLLVAVSTTSVVAALASWHLLEKHFLRHKDHVAQRQKRLALPTPAHQPIATG